jgi:hypothetical protein
VLQQDEEGREAQGRAHEGGQEGEEEVNFQVCGETLCALFGIGDTVYLKLHAWDDRVPGMVTSLHVRPGLVTFGVTWTDNRQETIHYGMELVGGEDEA